MNEAQTVVAKQGTGMVAGIIACVLAVLGILTLGTVFVPLAAIVAIFGTVIAIKNKNGAGIGVNVLAWVLTFFGLITSPFLLGYIGLALQTASPPSATAHQITESELNKARQDLRALEAALNLYKLDNFVYPTTNQGLQSLVEKPVSPPPSNWKVGGYVGRLPLDPWGQSYQYKSPGMHGAIDIYSQGPDKQSNADDIGNWMLK